MNTISDMHIKTIKSIEGYSTLTEYVSAAKRKGLKYLCVTDNGPKLKMSKVNLFKYIDNLPNEIDGIKIIKGIEANVMDLSSGMIDIDEGDAKHFDFISASYSNISEYDEKIINSFILTNLMYNIANNPLVNTITGMHTFKCGFDYDKIIKAMKENGKVIEISSNPFIYNDADDIQRSKKILEICKRNSAPICISSCATGVQDLGEFKQLMLCIKEIDFPEQLIINNNEKMLLSYLATFQELKTKKLKAKSDAFHKGYEINGVAYNDSVSVKI